MGNQLEETKGRSRKVKGTMSESNFEDSKRRPKPRKFLGQFRELNGTQALRG